MNVKLSWSEWEHQGQDLMAKVMLEYERSSAKLRHGMRPCTHRATLPCDIKPLPRTSWPKNGDAVVDAFKRLGAATSKDISQDLGIGHAIAVNTINSLIVKNVLRKIKIVDQVGESNGRWLMEVRP